MKALIFDSGTLINLSMNGLLYILEGLKDDSDIRFLITPSVKYEIIDRPINVPRFELGALRVKDLLEKGVLQLPDSLKISSKELDVKTKEFLEIANNLLKINGSPLKIVSEGEMSCLALSEILFSQNIENIIGVDERTTRTLCESPKDLSKMISARIHKKVEIASDNVNLFSKYEIVRSSEIILAAYKKGVIKIQGSKVLEALLYATKFKGSSISYEEINFLKKMVK